MTETERLTILYGDPALAPPERFNLKAGPLSVTYTADGDLRYIKWGNVEILRRLYAAIRDDRWGTVPATITEIERTIGPDSFRIVYDALHTREEKGIAFQWRGTITGDADGTITFDFDGECLTTFRRNRIGLCVLHPADLKGKSCIVTHTDGTREKGAFPDLIAPHQPFFDIAALRHEVRYGVVSTVTFAGDVFEMEDQRNWLDASYKTYSTPLAKPFPAEVEAGTRIRQAVTLKLAVAPDIEQPDEESRTIVKLGRDTGTTVSSVILSLPADAPNLGEQNTERLRNLLNGDKVGQGGVYIEVDLAQPGWREHLTDKLELAEKAELLPLIGVRLGELLPVDFAQYLSKFPWLPLYLIAPNKEAIERALSLKIDKLMLGGAWSTNFTELNRAELAPEEPLTSLIYAGNPQVHAFDSLSIMETPPIIAETVRKAKTFIRKQFSTTASRSIGVGPLTLYGSYNKEDLRQTALLGAAWYLSALAYATEQGASVMLCEPVGPRGVLSADGIPYPLYYALEALREVATATRLTVEVSDEQAVTCFAARRTQITTHATLITRYAFVINRLPDEQSVVIKGVRSKQVTVRYLDETNALTGFSAPEERATPDGEITLTLRPYAIVEIVAPQPGMDSEDMEDGR